MVGTESTQQAPRTKLMEIGSVTKDLINEQRTSKMRCATLSDLIVDEWYDAAETMMLETLDSLTSTLPQFYLALLLTVMSLILMMAQAVTAIQPRAALLDFGEGHLSE